MKPENKKFLEDNEHTWITLRDAGYMMGLDGATRSRMVAVIHEEFQPGYATDLWCPPCVSDMVMLLYRRFNEWRERNSVPVIDPLHSKKAEMLEGLLTKESTPPLKGPNGEGAGNPVQIKASFPKHPNKHRR